MLSLVNRVPKYRYEGNYTVIYPPEDQGPNAVDLILPGYGDDFHEWFFSVHYLSICAGYMGGTEDPDYVHLDCSLRPESFTFRSDDKFIIDYSSVGDLFPVVPRYNITSFNLRPPFAILVLGIAFTILGIAAVLYEPFRRPRSGSLSLVSVRLASLISVCLIGVFYNPKRPAYQWLIKGRRPRYSSLYLHRWLLQLSYEVGTTRNYMAAGQVTL